MNKKRVAGLLFYIIGVILLTELDQITKVIAENKLTEKSVPVIKGVFSLSFLRNPGAAWGMLSGKINMFVIFTILIFLIVTYVIINMPMTKKYYPLLLTLTFLIAGAVGNFIDRVRFGSVRDFLYFELIDFPVFNVADIYVTVSVFVFCILIIFVYKDDDFDFLKIKKSAGEEKAEEEKNE